MLTLTVSGNTAAEISQRLRDAAASFGASDLKAPSFCTPNLKASPNESGPKNEEKPTQKSEQKVEKKTTNAPKPTGSVTLETVAAKIAEICNNKSLGKEKAKELLASFGAKKGGELKPEDYADFVAKANALSTKPAEEEDGLM